MFSRFQAAWVLFYKHRLVYNIHTKRISQLFLVLEKKRSIKIEFRGVVRENFIQTKDNSSLNKNTFFFTESTELFICLKCQSYSAQIEFIAENKNLRQIKSLVGSRKKKNRL